MKEEIPEKRAGFKKLVINYCIGAALHNVKKCTDELMSDFKQTAKDITIIQRLNEINDMKR